MMTAKAFAMSAEELHSQGDQKHHLTILHLTTTSMELSFKAWIKLKGGTDQDLKSIGHDLQEAYDRAIVTGLGDPSGRVGEAVAILSPIYSQHYTRYFPDIHGFTALTADSLVRVCRSVALAVEGDVWPKDEDSPPLREG